MVNLQAALDALHANTDLEVELKAAGTMAQPQVPGPPAGGGSWRSSLAIHGPGSPCV